MLIVRTRLKGATSFFFNFATKVLHIDYRSEPIIKMLGLSILADSRISTYQVFLNKLIVSSIDCPDLQSQVNFKIPSF